MSFRTWGGRGVIPINPHIGLHKYGRTSIPPPSKALRRFLRASGWEGSRGGWEGLRGSWEGSRGGWEVLEGRLGGLERKLGGPLELLLCFP